MILFIQLQGGGLFTSLIPAGRFENNDCSYTFRQAKHCIVLKIYGPCYSYGGPGSVVGIATACRLDGPGI